jgi:NTP pyrophosphatase (non-canonical NTP hydrolase)
MQVNEYQGRAAETAIYPGKGEIQGLTYVSLGLTGEAGEIANKVKKIVRGDTELTPQVREDLAAELGDVMWYVSQVAEEIGYDLSDICSYNIDKLESRKNRGVLNGSGDNR